MGQRQLLLIDDEPAFGRFVAQAAEEAGFKAHVAMSAEPFKTKFREIGPDVVALDLGMPDSDGVELLRFLADENAHVPVIIVSGFDRRVLESSIRFGEALGLNMIGQLTKPVRLDELIEMLQRSQNTSPA
jgi:DNA-binding response OmpR family regulator